MCRRKNPATPDAMWKHQAKPPFGLTCCFTWTKNVTNDCAERLGKRARELLQAHSIKLDVCPGLVRTPECTVDFDVPVVHPNSDEPSEKARSNLDTLRHQVAKVHPEPEHEHRLPVIFCVLSDKAEDGFVTDSGPIAGVCIPGYPKPGCAGTWKRRFVLINTAVTNNESVTLVHEMGHASGIRKGTDVEPPGPACKDFPRPPSPPNRRRCPHYVAGGGCKAPGHKTCDDSSQEDDTWIMFHPSTLDPPQTRSKISMVDIERQDPKETESQCFRKAYFAVP